MTAHFPGLVQVQNGYPYTYSWPLSSLAWYRYKMDNGYPLCTCTKSGKWAVMYRCMGIHFVPVPSQGSERSWIGVWGSILYGTGTKWIPMHLYMIAHFPGLAQVQNGYPYTYSWPLTSLTWYRYKMDTHTPIHDRSLPWLGTGTHLYYQNMCGFFYS
jgi:hypothetical protein